MSLDTKLLEARLINRESLVIGPNVVGYNVGKCALKLAALKESDPLDTVKLHALAREVMLYQIEMNKVQGIIHACDNEIIDYGDLELAVEEQIVHTEKSISNLETELKQQQMIRKHREETEQLATTVNSLPSKTVLYKQIDTVEEGLKNTQESLQLLISRIAQRSNQFNDLMQCIAVLQSNLIDEDDANRQMDVAEDEEEEEDGVDTRGDDSRGSRNEIPIVKTTAYNDNTDEAADDSTTMDDGETNKELVENIKEDDTMEIAPSN